MVKFVFPAKFITIVSQFYDGMQASVQDDGVYSEPFSVTSHVKQGCVLAPTLFSMSFSAMLTDVFRLSDIGVDFNFQTDRKLFNLSRIQAKTKVQQDSARDFQFPDDCAVNAGTQWNMQERLNWLAKACDDFGLKISIKKTEAMHQIPTQKQLSRSTAKSFQ